MQKIIEIKNITVYRGQTRVFNNLSLDIPRGCHTVILGPNGAGKSTLLKLLSRELYPVQREGSYIRLFGQERWNVWELRAHFGIVSHDLQQQYVGNAQGVNIILSGYYSSIDTAAHQRFSAEDKERADRLIEKLGVTGLRERTFSAMSTGEQRRFLLGRALIHDPDALVLDEPTLGLDILYRKQFYNSLLNDYFDHNRTIVVTTHQVEEVQDVLTDLMFINHGRIVLQCTMEEFEAHYIEVMVHPDHVANARSLKPISERQVFGRSVFLFDQVDRDQLAALGDVRTPSIADVFVAVMSEGQTTDYGPGKPSAKAAAMTKHE